MHALDGIRWLLWRISAFAPALDPPELALSVHVAGPRHSGADGDQDDRHDQQRQHHYQHHALKPMRKRRPMKMPLSSLWLDPTACPNTCPTCPVAACAGRARLQTCAAPFPTPEPMREVRRRPAWCIAEALDPGRPFTHGVNRVARADRNVEPLENELLIKRRSTWKIHDEASSVRCPAPHAPVCPAPRWRLPSILIGGARKRGRKRPCVVSRPLSEC